MSNSNDPKPQPVRVDAKPVPNDAPAPTRAARRRATLFTVLTSPRAWVRFFRDKNAPKLPKLVAVLALLYVLSPLDAVPDFAVVIGWLDDLGVAGIASAWLASIATKYENKRDEEALPAGTEPPK
jgi:uncharacterized membrane protein YkvA (DUF1232 family)